MRLIEPFDEIEDLPCIPLEPVQSRFFTFVRQEADAKIGLNEPVNIGVEQQRTQDGIAFKPSLYFVDDVLLAEAVPRDFVVSQRSGGVFPNLYQCRCNSLCPIENDLRFKDGIVNFCQWRLTM